MSRRFQGGESSEILNQSSVKNEDMIQCRHEVGTVNDSDKAIPLSVIQSCPVATCETAGGTAAKVGVVNNFSDFTLLNGREVLVYFASGNTADNPTFNLNNTGAFPLALENQLSTVSIGSGCWGDGVFLHLKYVDITVSNTRIQKWIICGHRIASQSSTQTTYADGQGRTNTVASGNMQSVTSGAVNYFVESNFNKVNSHMSSRNNEYIEIGCTINAQDNQSFSLIEIQAGRVDGYFSSGIITIAYEGTRNFIRGIRTAVMSGVNIYAIKKDNQTYLYASLSSYSALNVKVAKNSRFNVTMKTVDNLDSNIIWNDEWLLIATN